MNTAIRTLALLALLLVGCTDSTTMIPRPDACLEQAHAWCDRLGFPTPACASWYVHECEPHGPDGTISEIDQDSCMEAIDTNPNPDIEPAACRATWL